MLPPLFAKLCPIFAIKGTNTNNMLYKTYNIYRKSSTFADEIRKTR